MIGTAQNVSDSYDAICELFGLINGFTTCLKIYLCRDIPLELEKIVAEILCCVIRVCGYTARLIKHGRIKEFLKNFVIGEDRKVAGELEKMKQLLLDLDRLVTALSFRLVSGMKDGLQVIHDHINVIVKGISNESSAQKNEVTLKQMDRIRLALQPKMASEEIYRGIAKGRLEGTGNWVREEPLFSAWLEGREPILWISGGPGAGKSYLASNIIEMLTQKLTQDGSKLATTSVAYFFCKDTDPDLRSFHNALKSIAYQLCERDVAFAKHVASVCSYTENIKSTGSTWKTLFLDFFCSNKSDSLAYVLIDGVDETTDAEREVFFQLLRDLLDVQKVGPKAPLRILQIGRYELSYEMNRVFEKPIPMIAITARKNSTDIEQYVKTRITREWNLRKIDEKLRNQIRDTLVTKADGMFLWVNLMLKEVSRKSRPADMREALLLMPKGLYEAMRQTFERLSQELYDQEAADLCVMLSWVACAKRPLTLCELDDVLKLTSEDGEGVVYLEGLLRNQYASFFTINREDGRTTGELQMENLIIKARSCTLLEDANAAHRSAALLPSIENEYIEDLGIDSDPSKTEVSLAHNSFASFFRDVRMSGKVGIDINQAEVAITKNLLGMICDGRSWRKWESRTISLYAAEHWQDHLRAIDLRVVKQCDIDEISRHIIKLFSDRKVAINWAQHNQFLRKNWFHKEENNTAVHSWLLRADLEPCQKDWVESLYSASPAEITDVLVAGSASGWLQGHIGAPEVFYIRIKAHHRMVSSWNIPSLIQMLASRAE
jgi:Cdc6-like AAA superfamily ATPase